MSNFHTFGSIVRKNEFKAIRGKGYKTIFYLSAILLFTFLCVGFSNSALIFRKQLETNPLSNWISAQIFTTDKNNLDTLMFEMSDSAIKRTFYLNSIYFSRTVGMNFLDRNHDESPANGTFRAKTIDPGNSIITDIFSSENVVKMPLTSKPFKDDLFGVVVTDSLLKQLGFHRDSVSYLSYVLSDRTIQVPILGIVKELPGRAELMLTDSLSICKLDLFPYDPEFSRLFLETKDRQRVNQIKQEICDRFGIATGPQSISDTLIEGSRPITILTFPKSWPQTDSIFYNYQANLVNLEGFSGLSFGMYQPVVKALDPDYIARYARQKSSFRFDLLFFEFGKPDKIVEFARYLKQRHHVLLDMESVRLRENFLFALNIALGAIFLTLIFSGISIILFLSNTLKNHLDRMRRNLGNFLAFGGRGSQLIAIYIYVVMKILIVSLVVGLCLAWAGGEFLDKYLLKEVLILKQNQDFFTLFNMYLYLYILVIMLVAVSKTWYNVWLLVIQPPGDLIYEREKKKKRAFLREKNNTRNRKE